MLKKFILYLIITTLLVFFIPSIIIPIYALCNNKTTDNPYSAPITQDTTIDLTSGQKISAYNSKTSEVMEMDFEDYIVGVIMGEMPASYEIEALKAQAVVARSYALSRMEYYKQNGTVPEHHEAMICTDSAHCEAWLSVEDAKSKWGSEWADTYMNKIKKAVSDTKGEYMSYNNQIVKAFFYSTSSGQTETAKDVWGGDNYPYLQSVPSVGDTTSPNFETTVEVSKVDFIEKLKSKFPNIKETSPLSSMIGKIEKTTGGSVATIEIGGKTFKGTEIRTLFNLRSANFELNANGDSVVFDVRGYGHGVGMSQYGANYMAKQGSNYKDILTHYYTDISISKLY